LAEEIPQPRGEEIFFGLCAAIGTSMDKIVGNLKNALSAVNYDLSEVKLSRLLAALQTGTALPKVRDETYYHSYMKAGNDLREKSGMKDAVALLGVSQIRKEREEKMGDSYTPIPRHAYVFNSLKHPSEVDSLRMIYGRSFSLISVYLPRKERRDKLATDFEEIHSNHNKEHFFPQAESLINKDEAETDNEFGQDVRDTFPKGDLFLDAKDNTKLQSGLDRYVRLMFGYQFHTPTKDEYSMFVARAVAVRSAALGRQVGAVVSTTDGDIIAVGTNEVPKGGGGLYWEDDSPPRLDGRDFAKIGADPNDERKRKMIAEMFTRLKANSWLSPELNARSAIELASKSLDTVLAGAEVVDLIAFDRTVHAEMAAITDAARRTIPVENCVLYTTTFPCHNCAKHIIASGITRCIYIEPYPKSRTFDLHDDAITHDQPLQEGKTSFESFMGIAPRIYLQYFTALDRKGDDGKILGWTPANSNPRYVKATLSYLTEETIHLKEFDDKYKGSK
jgi:cytidine deaminase